MIVLIPAYEPDARLVALVESLLAQHLDGSSDQRIVVVDDGSGPAYAQLFTALVAAGGGRCEVIGHPTNQGKGVALKSGIDHIARQYPGHDVVCADCDGQHTADDIAAVARALAERPGSIVLGARQFTGDVPSRSRFGNALTRLVFRAATGRHLQDTQTGLRGYSAALFDALLAAPGQRFEYELEVLLAAQRAGILIVEVPIATIYLDGNESSHFRPLHDSVRVYLPFVKFSLSSLVAFAVDAAVLFALFAATDRLLVSIVVARLVSATCNYVVNRRIVFRSDQGHRRAMWRYATLAAVLLCANYLLMRVLLGPLGLGVVPAKLITEATLFLASYAVQRRLIFARGRRPALSANSQLTPGVPASARETMAV